MDLAPPEGTRPGGAMRDDQRKDDKGSSADRRSAGGTPPFRESGSGASYDPDANWAAERGQDNASGVAGGMEGAPSGAGDGGFGPEGDFTGAGGKRAADVLGQVNGDNSGLVEEAQERGPRKADRRFTGGEGVDEPDSNRS